METVSLSKAIDDLRDGELIFWLQLHELHVPLVTGVAALTRKIAGTRTRPAIISYLRALAAKDYISVEETHEGKKKITLKRRLSVSAGAYARF